jgi:prepilin-type N-terminal cleavage/methylation domain-containing protein
MIKKSKCSGLTFIEMLLATAMVSVIAVAVYGMISNGIKVWEVVNQESPQIDASLLFERMSLDLENGVCFKGIDFIGLENSFSFACITKTLKSGQGFNKGIGQVKYSFDAQSKSVKRGYIDYEQLFALKQPEARNLIGNVNNVLFNYYYFDQQKKTFIWSNIWPPEAYTGQDKRALPLAVQISMVLESEKALIKKIKTLNIPIGAIEF